MIKPKLLTVFLCLFAAPLFGQTIKSVMINSCNSEGLNEYIVIKNGPSSFSANSVPIDLRYGTTSPASTTYTDTFQVNGDSNYIVGLNQKLSMGCDFQFINAKKI